VRGAAPGTRENVLIGAT